MNYYLLTLGCQMNRSDSERVRTVLDGLGFRATEDESAADILGIVACSVRQKAIDKVYTRIHRWNERKQDRPLLTFVSGCVLPADRAKFLKLFDMVFTMNELPQLPAMMRQYGVVTPFAVTAGGPDPEPADAAPAPEGLITPESLVRGGARRPVMTGLWRVPATPASAVSAFVPIQNGCDKFCTFCAVPYTRGREVSRPSADILREVDGLVARGFKSITLLGQNVNSYGRDKSGAEMDFASLLAEIGERGLRSGREFLVYYTSPHPRDMDDAVLDAMAAYPCLAKQVHLPMQSGDDKVLLRMNRQHSVAQYRSIMQSIRRKLPQATVFTDIIVGFSGETDAQFANTLAAMDEFAFNMAYIALYSPRPGAASSRWIDDVPLDVKRKRFQALNTKLQEHATRWNETLVGRTARVLVTGRSERQPGLHALTEGKVHVNVESEDAAWIGTFQDVEITGTGSLSLAARPAPAGALAG